MQKSALIDWECISLDIFLQYFSATEGKRRMHYINQINRAKRQMQGKCQLTLQIQFLPKLKGGSKVGHCIHYWSAIQNRQLPVVLETVLLFSCAELLCSVPVLYSCSLCAAESKQRKACMPELKQYPAKSIVFWFIIMEILLSSVSKWFENTEATPQHRYCTL